MAKSDVYSWRVDPALKAHLEGEARRRKMSLARLLDQIVSDWLDRRESVENDAALQARLHAEVLKSKGVMVGGDPYLAEQASERIKAKLRKRYAADWAD